MLNAPLLGIAFGLIAGIAAGSLWVALSAIVAAGILMALRKRYWALVAASVCVGSLVYIASIDNGIDDYLLNCNLRWRGLVAECSQGINHDYIICRVDSVQGEPLSSPVDVRVTLMSVDKRLMPGYRIDFGAKLRDNGFRPCVPDECDINANLRNRGVAASCIVANSDSICVISRDADLFPELRERMLVEMQRLRLTDGCYSFVAAVLLGDSSMLSPSTRQLLGNAGIAHMLALSGLHVGIIVMMLSLALTPLRSPKMRWARVIIIITLLWLFAVLTGMPPSVTRASIMASMVLVSLALQRDILPLNALCASAILILMLDPCALFSIGFQMSFAAVLSILLLSDPIARVFGEKGWRRAIGSYVGASFAAMASAGVLSIFYFHVFPVYFLLGNAIALLLLPPILLIAIFAIAMSLAGISAVLLGEALIFLYMLIERGSEMVGSLPGATVEGLYISPWALVPASLAVLALSYALRMRRWAFGVMAALLAVAAFLVTPMLRPNYPQSEYFITRNTLSSEILVRDADSLYLIVTGHGSDPAGSLAWAELIYGDYCGLRGLSHISLAPDSIDGVNLRRRGNLIFVGDERIAIVDGSGTPSARAKITKLLVARGFNGDIRKLYQDVGPDSILIGSDLHTTRAERYLKECLDDSIPVRRL